MAVALRLSRKGSKHSPFYHLVAIDSRKKRSGTYLELLGEYDPLGETMLHFNIEGAERWLALGAQPSATVKQLLKRAKSQAAVAVSAAS